MKFVNNLNNVTVGSVGQFLVNDNGKFAVVTARLINDTDIEKVQAISKPLITEVAMLPTMTRNNIVTLSAEQTAEVIAAIKKQGCKKGSTYMIETTCSSGARYTLVEAEQLGEGIGYKLDKHGAKVPCVMPKEERVKRGLERTIVAVMVFDGNGEQDLYNSRMYHSESVVDSLAK